MDRLPPSLAAELARQYDVVRLLGRGGMGAVWLARERSLDRYVAIKVLSDDSIDSARLRERFRREARVAARLVHPNIVPLYAFGETADALYFAMGYVDGETLAARLDREGRLSRKLALQILGEISDALAFAHREGVIHRDVKPENILLDSKSGRAMLADFGVAHIAGGGASMTMTGMAVGTPSYMSPEQAAGERDIDEGSDIYSLSVVGYRMLAGRLPFSPASLQSLLAQHTVAKPDDLALIVAPGDRGVARVLMRGLEKNPASRWRRADDLRDALQADAAEPAALPEELERIEGLGTGLLAPLGLWSVAMWWIGLATHAPRLGFVFGSLFGASLATLAGIRAFPPARVFGWRETIRTMFHPPSWWSSWWPRSLRRADDQWDRLPGFVRRFRGCRDISAVWVASQSLLFPAIIWPVFRGPLLPVMCNTLLFTGSTVALLVTRRRARRALMGLGLSKHDATKLCSAPNSATDAVWRNPQFTRALAPVLDDRASTRAPRTSSELAQAIAGLSDRLRRAGLLPDDDGRNAAQSVKEAIDGLEAEIERLHEQLDPAELERLDRRLAALGRSGDDADVRLLLESQRELWRRLQERSRQKEARRDRLYDHLKTLWMQLLELDARVTRGSPVDPGLTGQVRALFRDLSHTSDALTEVERLIVPAEPETVSSQG